MPIFKFVMFLLKTMVSQLKSFLSYVLSRIQELNEVLVLGYLKLVIIFANEIIAKIGLHFN